MGLNLGVKDDSVRDVTGVLTTICARRDARLQRSRRWRLGLAMSRSLLLMMVAMSALTIGCASRPQTNVGDDADSAGIEEPADLDIAVRSIIDRVGLPAAALVVDNASGIIVGSVVVGDTESAPLGGGVRPAGSVMKVLVLAAAVESGTNPDDILRVPLCIELPDRSACGPVPGDYTVAEAITASINPAFVLLWDRIPPGMVVEQGSRFGMLLEETPEAALGIHPVSMESVAAMFVAFATDGETRAITDQDGSVVVKASGRFVSEANAKALRSMLRSVVTNGTGKAADGDDAPFGKTGTALGPTDGWFVGSTATHTVVAWAGSPDGELPVAPPYYPGVVSGGGWPAQIFRAVADGLAGSP